MKPITYLCCFLLAIACNQNKDTEPIRTKQNINDQWQYAASTAYEIEELEKVREWQNISLPHTWNAEDVVDGTPGYRRNSGWYKKTLIVDKKLPSKQYNLYFEGANITTICFVNGTEVGKHIGGYLGFEFDITDYLKEGKNEVLVRVDNSYNPQIVPSQQSDFFIYGGITRDVWFTSRPKTAITDMKITTPKVSRENAEIQVALTLDSISDTSGAALVVTVNDPEGKTVKTKEVSFHGKSAQINFDALEKPMLWHIDTPQLYTVSAELKANGKTIDKVTDRIGLRWFEFKDHGPFYLNGERLLLRGTHRHEEHAGVSAAMTNAMHRKDMEQIKEMGANFVRLAHYPQDPEVYKACDELGLLVWDEIPWCRGGVGDAVWKTNTKNMLREMIDQNFNHPSIIIWSLGNEMYWLPEFEDGGDIEKLNGFLTELNDIAHEMDPSRKTAVRKYYEGSHIVDVFSPSIWSGWYSGSYKSYQKALDTYKPQYKHFLHAEYGGSSHVGRHSENPITGEGQIQSDGWEEAIVQTEVANIAQIGDWSENYIVDLFDWHLRITETDSTFVGNVQWAFKDFGTPLRPENDIPYVNQKGLVDRDGKPKDAYYVFKSYWGKEPFTYIESKTWTERQGPKGLPRDVSVFSNCERVTLFHNGTDLGTKEKNIKLFPASGLNWSVNFTEGKNELIAVGTKENSTVADTLQVNYRNVKNGKAKELILESEPLKNGNYLVTATALDENGLRCLDYEQRVYFQCLEGGELFENQGTPTGSEVITMSNGRARIEVRPNTARIPMKVMVMNQSFKGTYLTIPK